MTESKTFQYIKSPIDSSLVLICDHASNYLPDKMNSLGLSKETLYSHIAWDPGSAYLTKIISKSLKSHAILASYSRLLVDLNRNENHRLCRSELMAYAKYLMNSASPNIETSFKFYPTKIE